MGPEQIVDKNRGKYIMVKTSLLNLYGGLHIEIFHEFSSVFCLPTLAYILKHDPLSLVKTAANDPPKNGSQCGCVF